MSILLAPSDLSNQFNAVAPGPVTLNVDGQTVQASAAGVLSSPVTVLAYSNLTTELTYTDENGNNTVIDLGALTTDIFVNGGSFNAATSVLTLTDNDAGTPDVTVDLSTLLGVSTDANNVLNNGTDGKPLLTSTQLCDAIKADCVVTPGTPCTDLAGNDLGYLIAV